MMNCICRKTAQHKVGNDVADAPCEAHDMIGFFFCADWRVGVKRPGYATARACIDEVDETEDLVEYGRDNDEVSLHAKDIGEEDLEEEEAEREFEKKHSRDPCRGLCAKDLKSLSVY